MVTLPLVQPPSIFFALADEYGIACEANDVDRLARYLELLLETNKQFNLTSITDPEEAWITHIFDSLTLLPYIQASNDAPRIIDVGSGGGLPGVPLAIVHPDARFTLLEATGKKARFLERACDVLNLLNVSVVNQRAEVAGQDHGNHREQYDFVLSRAVGKLATLLEWTVPFGKVGGLILAIKGAKALAEIAEAKRTLHALQATVIDTRRTPTGTIVAIEKLRKTPRVYPRRAGATRRKSR